MLRKLFVFILLSASTGAAANAQQPRPESKKPAERKAQAMVYTTLFEGSYLGVQTKDISKENASQFGLSEVRGVAVEKVLENSPAAQAGLQSGDVFIKFNGDEITGTRKLTRLISEVSPDHTASLTILRNGSEREISVTIGKRPVPKFENGTFGMFTPAPLGGMSAVPPTGEVPQIRELPLLKDGESNFFVWRGGASRQIGAGIAPLTKQLGDYFGVAEGKGILVNNVIENSPADKAGLKAGDVIVEIDGKEVSRTFDLHRAVGEKKEGDVTLIVVRDRNRQTFRVTPEVIKGGNLPFGSFENFGEGNQFNFRVQPTVAPTAPAQIITPPRIL